jgi:hypothetical protein
LTETKANRKARLSGELFLFSLCKKTPTTALLSFLKQSFTTLGVEEGRYELEVQSSKLKGRRGEWMIEDGGWRIEVGKRE